jgi:cyanobactin maturation PatA/PatG family protease
MPSKVKPSTAHSGHVYALGTLSYDFGDAARRDTFKQKMAPVNLDGALVPPDPYDARQMVEHLDNNPDEAHSLIWTLNLEQNTIYALDPKGPFANDIYEMFLLMLNGQLEPETSAEFIERVSIPGRQTTRTVQLFSGEVVPVLNVRHPRGMYGWNTNALVNAALVTVEDLEEIGEERLREGLTAFLNRVYYDLHNLGQTSRDRALNFAVTNTFQAASTFADAIASGRQLDTIEVEKSPYCRLNSDCWDILLTFFDPDSALRSRQVFRFTLDVADSVPVTVGRVRRWSIPGKKG